MTEETVEEKRPTKWITSDEAVQRLVPIVRTRQKVHELLKAGVLRGMRLTARGHWWIDEESVERVLRGEIEVPG